jgi:hypothetical protein
VLLAGLVLLLLGVFLTVVALNAGAMGADILFWVLTLMAAGSVGGGVTLIRRRRRR